MRCFSSLGFGALVFLVSLAGCSGGDDGAAPSDASTDDVTTLPITGDDAASPRDGGGAPSQGSDAGTPTTGNDSGGDDAGTPLMPGTPIDAGPTVAGTITVDPTTQVGTVPPSFLGLSYEKSQLPTGLFSGSDTALIAMFKLLGPGLLRIGGNSVDRTEWYTAPTSDGSAASTITTKEVDDLAAFAKASGWKVLYGVDMKLSSPDIAAAEAKYVTGSLGASLYGFEIGNEVDLYTSTAESSTWSYSIFKTQWASFASAILASAGASTVLTGPASAANYSTWTVPFAADDGSQIQLLTQHYYRGNGQSATSTLAELMTPDTGLDTELAALNTAATNAKISGGYRLSECNSYYNGGAPNVSDAYGTAFWLLDFLFQNAEHTCSGINLHGGGDGPGYTPIADDSNGNVVEARPEYYGALLFALAGQGSVYKTTVTVSGINVTAYAVGASDGSTNVVVVSKDATNGIDATIDLGKTVAAAGVTYLQGPALDGTTGLSIAEAPVQGSGAWDRTGPIPLTVSGTKVTVSVPAASAALIHAK
jgi:hypothetical protein